MPSSGPVSGTKCKNRPSSSVGAVQPNACNMGVPQVVTNGQAVMAGCLGHRLTDPDMTLSCHPARATARRLPPSVGNLSSADPQQLAMLGINPPTASLLLDEASDLKPGDCTQRGETPGILDGCRVHSD